MISFNRDGVLDEIHAGIGGLQACHGKQAATQEVIAGRCEARAKPDKRVRVLGKKTGLLVQAGARHAQNKWLGEEQDWVSKGRCRVDCAFCARDRMCGMNVPNPLACEKSRFEKKA